MKKSKRKIPINASRGLKWENKMYKIKRSIVLAFCQSISYIMQQCAALCTMSLTKSHPLTFQTSSLKLATCIFIIRVPLHLKIIINKITRLEVQNKAFSRVGPRLWNELPARMRSLPVKTFKNELNNLPLSVLEQCDDFLDTDQITFALKESDHMKHWL